ncbi:exosortase X [Salinibacter ruber]|uniref:exosortase X n=1 Tax=Salinibacter ruber TaxID=146919 RepID=UPI0021697B53
MASSSEEDRTAVRRLPSAVLKRRILCALSGARALVSTSSLALPTLRGSPPACPMLSRWIMSPSARSVLRFLAKVLAVYVVWYVVYNLWLLPDGRLDAWLSQHVAGVSSTLLTGVGHDASVASRSVTMPGISGVRVADGCNGLATIGLFVGFVVAYPGRFWRRLAFLPLGILVIYATNVGRVVVMVLTQKYWPAAFDPLHGFGLTTIFYVVVFGLWVVWANYGGVPGLHTPPPPRLRRTLHNARPTVDNTLFCLPIRCAAGSWGLGLRAFFWASISPCGGRPCVRRTLRTSLGPF